MMSAPAERLDTTPPDLMVETGAGETFLFAYLSTLQDLGVFVRSERPLPIGTKLHLGFEGSDLVLLGEVVWINPVRNGDNPNPGMGIRLVGLDLENRDELVSLVRSIAYLDDPTDAN